MAESVVEKKPSVEEMKQCLHRSGYLLESRLVKLAKSLGFDAYPGPALYDTQTGKYREIDLLVSECLEFDYKHFLQVQTSVVIEAVNNPWPVILLTEDTVSTGDMHMAETDGGSEIMKDIASRISFHGIYQLKWPNTHKTYAQYCGIVQKGSGKSKNTSNPPEPEYMVNHTEDLHSSISKLVQYVSQDERAFRASRMEGEQGKRLWFWKPILVLGGDLYVVDDSKSPDIELIKTNHAQMIHNWYDREAHIGHAQSATVIDVVTEEGLSHVLKETMAVDAEIRRIVLKKLDEV